jgi:hypothetical protein
MHGLRLASGKRTRAAHDTTRRERERHRALAVEASSWWPSRTSIEG